MQWTWNFKSLINDNHSFYSTAQNNLFDTEIQIPARKEEVNMEKGKVHYEQTITDGKNVSQFIVYENGNMTCSVTEIEKTKSAKE